MNAKRTVILTLAAALTLSGCTLKFVPDSISGEQVGERLVRLDFGACFAHQDSCRGWFSPVGVGGQALIAIRAHKETGMPNEFSSISGMTVTLTRNRAYSRQLNQLVPHGTKTRWFGYRSAPQADQEMANTEFEVQMAVPPDFPHDYFPVTPAVGVAAGQLKIEVDCGTDAFLPAEGDVRVCISDPHTAEDLQKVKIPLTGEG